MKLLLENWRKYLKENQEVGSFKLFPPDSTDPYGEYRSLENLKGALDDIKKYSQDWEDWTITTPEEKALPAYSLQEESDNDLKEIFGFGKKELPPPEEDISGTEVLLGIPWTWLDIKAVIKSGNGIRGALGLDTYYSRSETDPRWPPPKLDQPKSARLKRVMSHVNMLQGNPARWLHDLFEITHRKWRSDEPTKPRSHLGWEVNAYLKARDESDGKHLTEWWSHIWRPWIEKIKELVNEKKLSIDQLDDIERHLIREWGTLDFVLRPQAEGLSSRYLENIKKDLNSQKAKLRAGPGSLSLAPEKGAGLSFPEQEGALSLTEKWRKYWNNETIT